MNFNDRLSVRAWPETVRQSEGSGKRGLSYLRNVKEVKGKIWDENKGSSFFVKTELQIECKHEIR